jgi:predicted alpha/beta-hydrolase family hydrolase
MPASSSACSPIERNGVRGVLHLPEGTATSGIVLTHGAGGNCEAPLLFALAGAFAEAGWAVLRCDLPFRQKRPRGPPSPSTAAADREGLRAAVEMLRECAQGAVCLGGQSYGGRQASMLAAEQPGLARRLLLLSYPLHPPGKPERPRTAHFPDLRTPALFVHGTADPFGSIPELSAALASIPAPTRLLTIEGVGHDLGRGRRPSVVSEIVAALQAIGEGARKDVR